MLRALGLLRSCYEIDYVSSWRVDVQVTYRDEVFVEGTTRSSFIYAYAFGWNVVNLCRCIMYV